MKTRLLVALFLLAAAPADAKFFEGVPLAASIDPNTGSLTVSVEFRGDAGEKPVQVLFTNVASQADLKKRAELKIVDLNAARATQTAIAGIIGKPVDLTPDPGKTAREVARDAWLADFRLLMRLRQAQPFPAGALTTGIDALATSLHSRYEALSAADRDFYRQAM